MTLVTLLQANPLLFNIIIGLLGLCIGSFLNVVIYRLPLMLEASWKEQCHTLLNHPQDLSLRKTINLARPASHCPHCKKAIPVWQNIPVLSYLLLKGKCAYCKQKISMQYLIIELITALASITIAYHFGFSWHTLGGLMLTWSLIPLTVIDIKHQLLPDEITLPLLWIGLLFNLFNTFVPLADAVLGASIGYLSLWSFTYLYKLITNKMGMGHGDFKLFAVFGAWLGWQALPVIITVAAFLGALFGITWLIISRQKASTPIAFGPYLGIIGWLCFILQNHLQIGYHLFYGFN